MANRIAGDYTARITTKMIITRISVLEPTGRPRWLGRMRVQLVSSRSRVRSLPSPAPFFFIDIDDEIISNVILSLPFIQEGDLSVSGERMCTSIG